MIITQHGLLIRQHINRISTLSRNTQGVRLINLHEGDRISAIRYVMESEEIVDEEDSALQDMKSDE
jgi:DNA gyrase subunit A